MDDGDKSRRRVVKLGAESTFDQLVEYHDEKLQKYQEFNNHMHMTYKLYLTLPM